MARRALFFRLLPVFRHHEAQYGRAQQNPCLDFSAFSNRQDYYIFTAAAAEGHVISHNEFPQSPPVPSGVPIRTDILENESGMGWARSEMRDGLQVGDDLRWYDNGQLYWLRPFLDGELHGDASFWYRNGPVACKIGYIKGRRHGLLRCWHPNGVQACEALYRNGVLAERPRFWDRRGRTASGSAPGSMMDSGGE